MNTTQFSLTYEWIFPNYSLSNIIIHLWGSCFFFFMASWVTRYYRPGNYNIGKDSDAGRDWGQEEKGMTEDEIAGWHHWLDGSDSEWTQGVGDRQGGLAGCDLWGCKESDTTELLNWTELNWTVTQADLIDRT